MPATPVTAAYVFDRPTLLFRDEDAAHLDQLNYSFALVRDGRVNGDHWEHIDAYKAFITRHPHILPVVSVGGWGADGFSQAAATEAGRALFVESTLELMQAHGFLGVDIDWEYPCSDAAQIAASPDDRENFTLLLAALREGLDALTARDGKTRMLATALGASPDLVQNIDCAAVGRIVDQINLMTYDIQTGHVVSHMTPLYSASPRCPMCADLAVRVYSEAGIPKEKIMIGSAFYARLFASADGNAPALFADSPSAGFDTARYRELTQENGWTLHFDETACAAYSIKGDLFATHDSPQSIACKGEYVRKQGLMGLMCWEYGGDVDGRLLAAMHEGLNPSFITRRPTMNIQCVWEHNGGDSLIYAVDCIGAYTRGESKEAAISKMQEEIASYLAWKGEEIPDAVTVEIVQDKPCDLQIADADSDVIFDSETKPLSMEEYLNLKALALKSAEDFHALYMSIPDKSASRLPERTTFYGKVPRTAQEMYEHTKSVNAYYFGEIGVDADNDGTIEACRRRGFELLEKTPDFLSNPVVEGSYGELWSVRKVLRRFIWHDRIHARAMYRMALKTFYSADVQNPFRFLR